MKPERWVQVENLYNQIVELEPSEREARLAGIFDNDLRNEVLSLIEAGALSSSVAAFLKEERGRILAQEVPTYPLQNAPPTHAFLPASRTFKPDDVLASRYRILQLLGHGGMGEVYEAEDRDLGERIAIKVIRPEAALEGAWVDRFRREVQLARKVTHPNVCRVFDLERHRQEDQEIFFLTMELVRGETLAARLKRIGRFSIPEAFPIATQLCSALHAAHQAGILHRDFKCGNVMLVGAGEQVRAVVTDFGTARPLDNARTSPHTVTQPSAILGTPAYMSPEQLEGRELTPASDIYSLGLVLYEMATGKRPFCGDSQRAEAMARLKEDPAPPIHIVPGLGRSWNRVILQCLRRNPAKRFSSAAEIAESLAAAGAGYWLRLHRRIAAVAALVVLAAVAAFAFRSRLFLPALPATKHIAVLPFSFTGDDPANLAMASALAESLTGNLSHLQTSDGLVWVVPWKSVHERVSKDEKHAGASLGANLLLTGEVARLGDGLHLHARLLDANTLKELRSTVVQVSSEKIATLEDSLLAQAGAMLQLELPPGMLHHLPADETREPGAYEFYVQGHGYMLRREATSMDRAISLFQKAIEKDPKFAPAYADLGFAYAWKYGFSHEKSWLDQASEACAQALALNDKLASAHVSFGLIQRHSGHLEQAIAEFQKALQLDPDNDDAPDLLSNAYDTSGRVLQAETLLKNTLNRNPANWVAYDSLGVFYYFHANYAQAEPLFRAAAELAPDNPIAFDHLGVIYYSGGRFKDAEDMLRKSIAIKPTAEAYTNLGTVLRDEHREADSVAMLEKAAELTPGNHSVWFNLGNAYYLLNEPGRAITAYEKAVEAAKKGLRINPGNGDLLLGLAQYYAMLGQKEEALHDLNQIMEPFASAPETLFKAAVVYQLVGKSDLALRNIRLAVQAGVPVQRIETTDTFAGLRKDKRYIEITKNHSSIGTD